MSATSGQLPDWELVLSAAARLGEIEPKAVGAVLEQLESAAGWRTGTPEMVPNSLNGIETGVRQLIRKRPLETTSVTSHGAGATLPTLPEILRVKAVLILRRNATRDYVDLAALSARLGTEATASALAPFDELYPQANGESTLQQLQAQLANPMPCDFETTNLAESQNLAPRWHDWQTVKDACARAATAAFDHACAKGGRGDR